MAEALLIDRETVRNHFKRYRKGVCLYCSKMMLAVETVLTKEQLQFLDRHLSENLYLTAKEIAHHVEQTWRITYSESGILQLHRLGCVYKKPKLIPGKANVEQQKDFVKRYRNLKAEKAPDDPIYFMDATHPHHSPIAGYG